MAARFWRGALRMFQTAGVRRGFPPAIYIADFVAVQDTTQTS